MGRLAGKVIAIVGGTSGLGRSAVLACVAEGAKVVVVGRDGEKLKQVAEQCGDMVRTVQGDATQAETAERAVSEAVRVFGKLDGLYHVAGGSGRAWGDGPLDQVTDEAWRRTLEWNLTSVFYSNRAAVRQWLRDGCGGSIVNMSSVLADSPSPRYFGTLTYATAKAAIIGLTRAVAAQYAARNIRCNAVAPGLIDTPLAERARSDAAIMRYVQTKQPLDGGRIGRPDDVDGAVVYLLSDESRFVTGQVLRVDGGWSICEGRMPDGSAAADGQRG